MKEDFDIPGIRFSFKTITYSNEFNAVIIFCYFMTICSLIQSQGNKSLGHFYIVLYLILIWIMKPLFIYVHGLQKQFGCGVFTYLDSIPKTQDLNILERCSRFHLPLD